MNNEPEQIRRDIEHTQHKVSSDVDALAAKVSPSQILHRRTDQVRSVFQGAREKVMGTVADAVDTTGNAMASTAEQVRNATSSVTETAPRAIRQRTQGNPLAAGLIAFGLGWLVSSLLPASQPEKRLATQLKNATAEHSDAIKEQVTGMAQEMKENLREPAQQAMGSVKSTAADGVEAVKEEGKYAAQDVQDRLQAR